MAKAPTTKSPRAPRVPATPATAAPSIAADTPPESSAPPTADTPPEASTPPIVGELADGDTIRMLTGQEGPTLSRVRGQLLTIGVDLHVAEAQRLVDADFAERT